MNELPQSTSRQLRPEDLDRVIEIDRRITGRSRRVFFEKRLEAALADAPGFIAMAVEREGKLAGYAIARLQDGEFGDARRVATLDVIGVDPEYYNQGQGKLLLQSVTAVMNKLDVHEMRTQVDWNEPSLIRFFAANGFTLAPRQVLERSTARQAWDLREEHRGSQSGFGNDAPESVSSFEVTARRLDAGIPDYSDPGGDDFEALSRDKVPVRSLQPQDLAAIVRIDGKLTGRDRSAYFDAKLREVLGETGVRVSLVAEVDGRPAGYVMARVDYGEFGRTEPAAVLDTIGVDPGFAHHGIGTALLSQLIMNLDNLHVEILRTTVAWNSFSLLGFFDRADFVPSQQLVLIKQTE